MLQNEPYDVERVEALIDTHFPQIDTGIAGDVGLRPRRLYRAANLAPR
jgi:hypothetical protein